MSVKVKVLYNTLIQLVNRFALAGSAFIVSLIIARFFGARGFGEYSKATTFIAIFYLIADFGLNAIVLRRITNNPSEEVKTVRKLLGLRLVSGVILVALAILITLILPYDLLRNEGFTPIAKSSIVVLSVLILYQTFLNTANVIFQKHLKYEQSTLASIVGSVTTVLSVIILLFISQSLPIVLLGYAVGAVFSSLILYFFVKKMFLQFTPIFSLSDSKMLIKAALPLGLTLIFNLVYFRADVFILTLYRTTTEVGVYSLAYKFFEFPLTIPTFFANSLFPIFLERAKNKRVFNNTVFKAGLFLLVLSFIIMIGLYVCSPLLGLIRQDFIPSIYVLRLLSFSMPIFFLSSLFMWVLITYGKNKELLTIYFLGLLFNIFLNIIFIPGYGINAAAVITLISEFFILVLSFLSTIRLLKNE